MEAHEPWTECNVCRSVFRRDAEEILVKDGFSIVRCPSCGLVFRATLPTADELQDIYGIAYFGGTDAPATRDGYLDYVGDADVHRANARRRLARLAAFVSPGALLDVGCAAGFFVDEASRLGWQARGVDVSEAMVRVAREQTAADVRVGTLADAPEDRLESCVTMWDYIEHAVDPRGDVERAFARLRPGGVLALSTGDAGSVLARLSLARWHLMTPRHHNYFFDVRTMTRLLESVGFDVRYVGHPSAAYPVRYLAHKACLVVRGRLSEAVARRLDKARLGSTALPVNLWDVMTVVAVRPAAG